MPGIDILPHHHPPSSAWSRGAWSVSIGGGPSHELGRVLNGWDYASTLRIRSETTIDLPLIHEGCRTADDARYELIAIWDCAATGERAVGARTPIRGAGAIALVSEFEIPPGLIAGSLRLERQVVLTSPSLDGDPLSPSVPGAIVLWERHQDAQTVDLEGAAGRFPVEAINFAENGMPDAAWWLSVAYDDPNDSFLGAVRLYINSGHPAISGLLGRPSEETSQYTVSLLRWDAVRRLLYHTVNDDRMLADRFEEGSVGEVVRGIARGVLQSGDLASLYSLVRSDPDRFEQLVQAKVGLLRDG